MKKLLNKVLEATIVLLSILFLGSLVPFVIAFFVAIGTKYTLIDCTICNPIFWLFSIAGWFIAGYYINEVVTEEDHK